MKIPYLRSKAQDGDPQVRLRSQRPFRQGADQRAGKLSARRAVPDRRCRRCASMPRRSSAWSSARACGRWCRVDQFDRFVSVIVFVPRDRYDIRRPREDRRLSEDRLRGPAFGLLSGLPGRRPGARPFHHRPLRRQDAEGRPGRRSRRRSATSSAPGRTRCARRRPSSGADAALLAHRRALSRELSRLLHRRRGAARRRAASPPSAPTTPIAIDYYRHADQPPEQAALKIYHHGTPVALSRRVPMLENIGFRVISERTFEVDGGDDGPVFIHDMELENAFGKPIDLSDGGKLFEEVFLSVWRGEADNDGYNALAQTAGLGVARDRRAARLWPLSAAGRHPAEPGLHRRRAQPLSRHRARRCTTCSWPASIRRPAREGEVTAKHLKAKIKDALEDVPNIDDDTIIRRYLNLIEASLRTNHFVPGLREQGPVAGDQARFARGRRPAGPAAVARDLRLRRRGRGRASALRPGGARRPALVGPGAGLPHRGARPGQGAAGQERRHRAGRRQGRLLPQAPAGRRQPRRRFSRPARKAYVNFVSSLLSITDNIDGDEVVPPAGRGAPRRRRSLFRRRRRQGHGDLLRHRQRHQPGARLLARRRLRLGRLGRLRPQEDGHHRQGRLGSGEAAFPRDEPRHPDDALHRRRRRRHVGRRVRQRHAAVGRRSG